MQIQNLKKLTDKLRTQAAKVKEQGEIAVAVGYTQSYAIYVHENMTAQHTNGQAKFLEQPARTLGPSLREDIRAALKRKRTMGQALLTAGLRLQRESQRLCPVDTAALKNSAFTRLEGATGSKSAEGGASGG